MHPEKRNARSILIFYIIGLKKRIVYFLYKYMEVISDFDLTITLREHKVLKKIYELIVW